MSVGVVYLSCIWVRAWQGACTAAKHSPVEMVGLHYMHLKYERGLIWGAIPFPVVLVAVMIVGFLPDALFPYGH